MKFIDSTKTLKVNGQDLEFGANGYTITANNYETLNVSYENLAGGNYETLWANIENLDASLNRFKVKVANPGTQDVMVRLDVEGNILTEKENASGTMAQCNDWAYQDGVLVPTDKTYGGSSFVVKAETTSELEVIFDASKKVNKVVIFVDSHNYEEKGKDVLHTGSITFSEMEFDDPGLLKYNWSSENLTTGLTNGQLVDSFNLAYNKATAGEEWECAGLLFAEDLTGKDTFTVKVKNNSSTLAKFKIELRVGDNAIPVTAVATNAAEIDAASATVAVAGNKEVVLKITYDAANKPDGLVFFPALAGVAGDKVDLTFSDFEFSTEGTSKQASFWTSSDSNVSNDFGTNKDTVNVKYTGKNASYQTFGAWMNDLNGNNTFSVKIKNNGAKETKVRVDVQDQINAEENKNTICCVGAVALGGGKDVSTSDGSAYVTLAPNEEVILIVSYKTEREGAYFGNIMFFLALEETDETVVTDVTVSNFKFYTAE